MKPHSASVRRARPLLGTFVEIRIAGNGAAAMDAVDAAFECIARVHRLMSAHDPSSDVSRINRSPAGSPVVVDAWTWRVLARAKEISLATDGLFDCCVAPRLQQTGYLPKWPDAQLPDAHGTHRDIELLDARMVRARLPLQITLDGIAKGFAVDRAVHALRHAGIASGIVNAGGDLRVFGNEPVPVHARVPACPGLLMPLVRLQNAALATSAPYFSRKTHDGKAVSHIFNPITRATCVAQTSASIIARDCMTADAVAKAMLLDPARIGPRLAALGLRAVTLDTGESPCKSAA